MSRQSLDTRFHQPTSFIGRTAELVELKKLLIDPACRLITLVGPGGTGKTRLSVEAARLYGDEFADGAVVVPLQPLTSPDLLVPAIAAELGLTLRGQEDPASQLFDHLAERNLLLVLDNFEHIVDAAAFLAEMLAAAPGIKLLVSSREALNLNGEWVFNLAGLSFPDNGDAASAEWYDSVRLFVDRARRLKRDFAPDQHWEAISRICRLVQGTPLAVELAATWLKSISPDEIVAEIERNLDFLSTSVRNVPERHRSVRAVFEESWRLLDDKERVVLARLSVFSGSFDRKAAEAVAGANLPLLTALIEKSLLRPLSDGRYQLHTLLNQYAGEKLAESPDAVESALNEHAKYYLDLLAGLAGRVWGAGQLEASATANPEMDNIIAAWRRAVDAGDTERVTETAYVLGQCCQFKSRYVEGAALMSYALEGMEKLPPSQAVDFALANCLVQLAWFQIRLGAIDDAEAGASRSRELMARVDMPPLAGFASDPHCASGIIATIRGNYTEAAQLGEEALQIAEKHDDPGNAMLAHYVVGRADFLTGDIEGAHDHFAAALKIAEQLGERWFRGYCMVEIGNVARARGDIEDARRYYQSAYDLRNEFEDPEGMAVSLVFLGDIARQQGAFSDATSYYDRALAIYQEIRDKGGLAQALAGAARAAAATGDPDHARQHIREGLSYAAEINHVPQVISLLGDLGAIELSEGDEEQAFPLLCVALHHPGSSHEDRARIQDLGDVVKRIEKCDVQTSVRALTEALHLDSDLGIEQLLAEAAAESHSAPSETLPGGLTSREVEILRLLAAGKSNQQIADELFITTNTVANHVKNILSKTQSANRTEAAAYANAHNLT